MSTSSILAAVMIMTGPSDPDGAMMEPETMAMVSSVDTVHAGRLIRKVDCCWKEIALVGCNPITIPALTIVQTVMGPSLVAIPARRHTGMAISRGCCMRGLARIDRPAYRPNNSQHGGYPRTRPIGRDDAESINTIFFETIMHGQKQWSLFQERGRLFSRASASLRDLPRFFYFYFDLFFLVILFYFSHLTWKSCRSSSSSWRSPVMFGLDCQSTAQSETRWRMWSPVPWPWTSNTICITIAFIITP